MSITQNCLDFEQPIYELEAKIDALRHTGSSAEVNISEEVERLRKKSDDLTKSIFSKLSDFQTVKVARHPDRPYALDYIERVFTDFDECHGDRHLSDGPAIIGGIARLNDKPVMVIAQQKGRGTKQKIKRNFGMPQPDGYRKAVRLMTLAERFNMPVVTLIDTPGAYPGIEAEERNQSEAIAHNLQVMSRLKVPIICTVIGEGGSGGALAIGVGDAVMMLQYSVYSVISPEGCAAILWKSNEKAEEAASAMGMTADKLLKLGLIDSIIPEPLGGAHRNWSGACEALKSSLIEKLDMLSSMDEQALLAKRYQRLMAVGRKA